MAAKIEVLRGLRGSEPRDFYQVGNHASEYSRNTGKASYPAGDDAKVIMRIRLYFRAMAPKVVSSG